MRKSSFYTVFAVVAFVAGAIAVAIGALTAATFGADDSLSSAKSRISGNGTAVIADDLEAKVSTLPLPAGVGRLTLDVTPADRGDAVFLGSAASADVDTYLVAVPYDVLVDLPPGGRARLRSVPGVGVPDAPTGQSFWRTSAVGLPGRSVSSELSDLSQSTVVVTNVVPRAGVAVDIVATLEVPGVWRASWIAIAGGVAAVLIACLALWRASASRRRRSHVLAEAVIADPVTNAATILPWSSSAVGLPPPTLEPAAVVPPAAPPPSPVPTAPAESPAAALAVEEVLPAPPLAALAELVDESMKPPATSPERRHGS